MIRGLYLINWPSKVRAYGQIDSAISAGINTLFVALSDFPGLAPMKHWGRRPEAMAAIERYAQRVRVYICPTMFRHNVPIRGAYQQFFSDRPFSDTSARLAHTPCPQSRAFLARRLGYCAKLAKEHGLAGVVMDAEPYASGAPDVLPVYTAPAGRYRCGCAQNGCSQITASAQWEHHAAIARDMLRAVPRFGQIGSTQNWLKHFARNATPLALYERTYERISCWPWTRARREVKTLSANGWTALPGIWTERLSPSKIIRLAEGAARMRGSGGYWLYSQANFEPGASLGDLPSGLDVRSMGVRDPTFFTRLAKLNEKLAKGDGNDVD